MNQIFAGCVGVLFAFVLWALGKKTQGSLESQKNFLQRGVEERSLIIESRIKNKLTSHPKHSNTYIPPKTKQEKIILKKKLFKLMSKGPEERLIAINEAQKWGNAVVLPLLIRGLKDFDSRVVIASAAGLKKIKNAKLNNYRTMRPPRNVFLMR